MTKLSTALLIISGKGFGPLSTPGWRVNGWIELVEGGGAGPILFCSSVETASEQRTIVRVPDLGSSSLEKAFVVGLHHLTRHADTSRPNIKVPKSLGLDGEVIYTDPSSLTEEQKMSLGLEISKNFRIGVCRLEENSLLDDQLSSSLAELGFQLDIFERKSRQPER